jgi:hypothetical protein
MLPAGLVGWALIVRDQQESLLAEARGDRLARAARADCCPSSRLRISLRRAAASSDGRGTDDGIDR